MTPASFKRAIRDLQVWCSSCMVAFAGSEPVGVLIGAKRSSATLIHRIAVHPDHLRQGHARHLLESLSSKLAILGPPRIVAEVPEPLHGASALFSAAGYVQEVSLTDFVRPPLPAGSGEEGAPVEAGPGRRSETDTFVIPVTVDDLAANGLLGSDVPPTCWQRSVETLMARREDIAGLAIASEARIEAYLLYIKDGEVVALRSLVEDAGARLSRLLDRLPGGLTFPKVHPAEVSRDLLQALGFRPGGSYGVFETRARAG